VRSVDLGSRRLTTRLLAGGARSPEAVEAARAAVAEAFSGLVPPAIRCALAAGGSARALRRLVGTLDVDGLAEAVDVLSRLKRSKVTKRYGISPQRAQTLLAGAILLAEVQRRLGLPFELAGGGVREGFALALFRESAAAYA
jgi:exopolyphosphatase/pppGpp-phosphohydrolase